MGGSENNIVTRLFGAGKNARFAELLKITGITGASQILIQAIGLVSGIAIIRLLPTEQYAFYTLANTMLGVIIVLADSGISAGVMAESGKVWKNPEDLGTVLKTGLDLRRKFAIGSLLVSAPILIYLLHHHGAGWIVSVIIVASLVPALIGSLTGSIFMVPMKLHQDIRPLQGNLIMESVSRLALIMSLFLLPWTFIALLAAGLPRLILNIRLRKFSIKYVDWHQNVDLEIRKRILKIVRRIMPGAVYYCVSGQVSIWLISIFGSTAGVAQIGALGRIAMLMTITSSLFATIVYPRFARLKDDSKELLKRFLQIMLLLLTVCIIAITAVYLFSDQILWVLGDEYSGLNIPLVLSIVGSCVTVLSGAVFKLSTNRSWVINPILSIPISVGSIIAGALLMNVSTLEGVLIFNIFVVSIQLALNSGYFFYKIFNKNQEQVAP